MTKTLGRVLGPLGGLAVLFALLSRVLTGAFSPFIWVELALGVVAIVVWSLTAFEDARNIATGRGAQYVVMTTVATLVLAVALGAGNYAATHKKIQWDMTKSGIFTLSEQTQSLLKGLNAQDKVKVTAFYQPMIDREYGPLNDLLARYKAIGGDNFDYEFVDGSKSPKLVKDLGITRSGPRIILKSQNGKEARAKEVTEEALTNALAELNQGAAKKIYFLTGHGEKPMAKGNDGASGLKLWTEGLKGEGYESDELNLFSRKDVPDDALAVVVAGPERPLTDGEISALGRYADKGGKLVLMLDPGYETGLEKFVQDRGVELGADEIIDPESQQPLWAMTQSFSDHPVAKPSKLGGIVPIPFTFPESRAVKKGAAKDGWTVTELFDTGSSAFGAKNISVDGGQVKAERVEGENGPLSLAAAVTKKLTGDNEARLAVFGDSDFASNEYIRYGGNRDLALNTIEWLAGNASKITIRPKLRDQSSLVALTRGQGELLSFGSLNVLPLILVAFGLSIWSLRRSK